jgi:hypothetical protein
MKIGDTFIWYPPGDRKEHLFIVLTDPALNDGKFAAFNLTKSLGGPMALTFQIGDHPYIIKYPSDVNFGDSLVFDIVNVERDIASGQAFQKEPMKPAMIEAIARKAIGHPAIPGEVEDLVKSQWHFPPD